MRRQQTLPFDRCREGIARSWERGEDGIALGPQDSSAVALDRLFQELIVLLKHRGVAITEGLEEPRGALDVGEQERDCSGREISHLGPRHVLSERVPVFSCRRRPPSGLRPDQCCLSRERYDFAAQSLLV
jgi:hypothetical protein